MMLFQRISTQVILCLLLVFTAACLPIKEPPTRIQSYSLEYDPPVFGKPKIPATIMLTPFAIAPDYNTEQIIYRDSPFARETYAYHRWQANPARMVQYFLARDMTESGSFTGVFPPNASQAATYTLDGALNEFLEIDEPEQWQASLSLTLTLQKTGEEDITKRILFQRTYSSRKSCQYRHPRALSQAMSEAMAEISAVIMQDIHAAIVAREKMNTTR